jgi:hypothetical protein
MHKIYLFLFLVSLLSSCVRDNKNLSSFPVNAWVPIYAQANQIDSILVETVKPTVNAGKIYAYGNYIFQNEAYKGFHIINNSNPATASKIAFLKVPFSTEIAIKGNFLYTNNVSDLVVFNISNINNPVLVKRVKDAFPVIDQKYPSVSNVYFECPDATKGTVVGWELKNIPQPKCRR